MKSNYAHTIFFFGDVPHNVDSTKCFVAGKNLEKSGLCFTPILGHASELVVQVNNYACILLFSCLTIASFNLPRISTFALLQYLWPNNNSNEIVGFKIKRNAQ